MSTQTDLDTMRDELELLGSMIRAERATPTQANQECTDEQLERCYALRDRLSLTQPKEGLSDEEIDRIASEHDQDELNDSRQDGYVTSADSHAFELGIKCGLRYLRDKGLLAAHSEVGEPVAWTTKLALDVMKANEGTPFGIIEAASKNIWGVDAVPLYTTPRPTEQP